VSSSQRGSRRCNPSRGYCYRGTPVLVQRYVRSHDNPYTGASKQNHVVADQHAGDVDATMPRHLRCEAAINLLRRKRPTSAVGTELTPGKAAAATALAAPHEEVAHVVDSSAATAAQPPYL
jgi:hypothetical protein